MNTNLKALFVVAGTVGLFVPAAAVSANSPGGVTGEARLHPGTWNNQHTSRSFARSRPVYRNSAPVIARSETVPNAVAHAPTERRSFSYEPAEDAVKAGGGCPQHAATPQADSSMKKDSMARKDATAIPQGTRRSYSYEPTIQAAPSVRSYDWHATAKKEPWQYQKTDPRRNAR